MESQLRHVATTSAGLMLSFRSDSSPPMAPRRQTVCGSLTGAGAEHLGSLTRPQVIQCHMRQQRAISEHIGAQAVPWDGPLAHYCTGVRTVGY